LLPQVLADESCSEVQSYLIGRPQPIEECAEVVGRLPDKQACGRELSCPRKEAARLPDGLPSHR
jgi:hypothetical protein